MECIRVKQGKVILPGPADSQTSSPVGCLYIVATPIGNLEDITLRALKILQSVDLIAAEDTRHSRKLLAHYQISARLVSYHAKNQERQGPELIRRLQAGQSIALVTDAGTPGFSDPGTALAALAWDNGLAVIAIPGPTAGIAALSIAGFKGDITFLGFLPKQAGKREQLLKGLAQEPRVLVFYESPHRLQHTLAEMNLTMPDRQILVARELTKFYEECWRGSISEVSAQVSGEAIKGECTLVLSRPQRPDRKVEDLDSYLLAAARNNQDSGRALVARVASELGLPRRQVYQAYLELKANKQL
jgi:16S rRNA (cytidine1402-2'-O)-methyltransferase